MTGAVSSRDMALPSSAGGAAPDCEAPSPPGGAASLARCASGPFVFDHVFMREHDSSSKLQDYYEVEGAQLGEGSFGSVSKARCKQTGILRAVKAIEIKSVKRPDRFEREIQIQKRLDHPNVVRLYEVFRDAKKIYLVMELCTGGELFDRIVDEAPAGFNEMTAASYIRQILSALCYIHAQKYCHRDVKPENFLLQSKAPDASLKIIDFGLACSFESGEKMTSKTGTAYYVAPDVLKGEYNERCDVWSAGVISYVLLCGFPPFAGDTDSEILKKVREGSFEFKSPEWDLIPQGAKNLVTAMLAIDPSLRPSAEVLLGSPWLVFKGTPEPVPIGTDFLRRIKSFHAYSRLKKVALTVVAQHLPDEELEGLKSTFQSLDKNGDGMLSAEEIHEGLRKQGVKVPKAFQDIVQNIDLDGSGKLDYTEFVAATLDKKLYQKRDVCWEAFRTFDLDGDGSITRDELHKVLNGDQVKRVLGKSRIDKMIQEVDVDGDGQIDFEEFCAMMGPQAKRRRVEGKK